MDGLESIFKHHVEPELNTLLLAKSLNRSVMGFMTDMVKFSELVLVEEHKTLEQVAAKLNETPFKALDYGRPREHFVALAT